jgi:hypothetical protein
MNTFETTSQIQQIMQRLDQLIAEMVVLRQQVVALSGTSSSSQTSVQQAEYFGMWADREDMQDRTSRAWLEDLRDQQWNRQ